MNAISIAGEFVSPAIDLFSYLQQGVGVVKDFNLLPGALGKIADTFRELKLLNFASHSAKLTKKVYYLVKPNTRGKEVYLTVMELVNQTGGLLESGGALVMALRTIGVVGAQVAAQAAVVSFVGAGIQAISIGIDTFRIYQSIREYRAISKVESILNDSVFALSEEDKKNYKDYEENGYLHSLKARAKRISLQSLFGLKAKEIAKKLNTSELRAHLKKRLTWGIVLRVVAIVVSLIGLAAIAVLSFAPTPAAPVGWALLGASAVIGITAVAVKLFLHFKHNREFKQLPDKP